MEVCLEIAIDLYGQASGLRNIPGIACRGGYVHYFIAIIVPIPMSVQALEFNAIMLPGKSMSSVCPC